MEIYTDINELKKDVEKLGDWKDNSQKDDFLRVVAKIAPIYQGYSLKENPMELRRFSPVVIEAIYEICKDKFPNSNQVFDGLGNIRPGYPDYSELLMFEGQKFSISSLKYKKELAEIAQNDLGIDIYDANASENEIENLEKTSREFLLEKDKKEYRELADLSVEDLEIKLAMEKRKNSKKEERIEDLDEKKAKEKLIRQIRKAREEGRGLDREIAELEKNAEFGHDTI